MTINLPDDLERFIRWEVHLGHFASEDDLVAAAVRLLRAQVSHATRTPTGGPTMPAVPDPVLGAMRDAALEMDEIVADARRQREQQP